MAGQANASRPFFFGGRLERRREKRGCSSTVERLLAMQKAEGSIPFIRSNTGGVIRRDGLAAGCKPAPIGRVVRLHRLPPTLKVGASPARYTSNGSVAISSVTTE